MRASSRRTVRFTIGLIIAWIIAAIIGGEVIRPAAGVQASNLIPAEFAVSDSLAWRLGRGFIAGLIAGLFSSVIELKIFSVLSRRVGAGLMLIARTVAYGIVALCSVLTVVYIIATIELEVTLAELFLSEGFQAFLGSKDFRDLILTFILSSFLINAAIQVMRVLGPRTAFQILLGRYLRPVHEDRLFLFIDLANSTAIAERLGPLEFAEFKNDFFHDLTVPVSDTGGQIVQYVGDEVMVTWPLLRRQQTMFDACVNCVFLLKRQIEERSKRYEDRYGVIPLFRAGVHGGPVVVSQIGDLKQEIVFSGDTVNAASRIQGLCRELSRDFLASAEVVEGVEISGDIRQEHLGEHSLKGRIESVFLVALSEGTLAADSGNLPPEL